MKKRIFISMHYMEIGGAESALIGMLQSIDYTRCDVDLFLHAHRGEMMQFIPKEVNLLPEIKEYAHIECPMKQALMDGCWGVLYGRVKAKWLTRRYMRKKGVAESSEGSQNVADCVSPFLPSLHFLGLYDLAISYLNIHNIVLDKVLSKKKICWIHTDYSNHDINVVHELPVWSAFDHVMSISPDVTKTTLQVMPSLKDKIVEMENILSPTFVQRRADEFDAMPELTKWWGDVNILSIGRFSYQKNFENVPDICRKVNANLNHNEDEKVSVKWFLIGYGGDEELVRQKIKEAGMEKNVIILGKRSNPYPYFKACDIYVQPSRYEGKSVTVREAQMLCKPVVITNYSTASSQVKDGMDGRIVPLDNEGCAKGLAKFILDKELQNIIVEHLQTHDYGNESEIGKLYKLIP